MITRFEAALRITCPPLRQRGEDILTLFTRLSEQFAEEYGCDAPQISAQEAAQILQAPWPGNVRELRNAADRFVLGLDPAATPSGTEDQSLSARMAAHEKSLITAALTANGGSLKQTYTALGLSRKALYEKMQKHGLSKAGVDTID